MSLSFDIFRGKIKLSLTVNLLNDAMTSSPTAAIALNQFTQNTAKINKISAKKINLGLYHIYYNHHKISLIFVPLR
jgi:hypothetical protein